MALARQRERLQMQIIPKQYHKVKSMLKLEKNYEVLNMTNVEYHLT